MRQALAGLCWLIFTCHCFKPLVALQTEQTKPSQQSFPQEFCPSEQFIDQTMTSKLDAMRGGLFGLFIGDALAMPVHWYYDVRKIARDFGSIQGYVAPKMKLDGSILSLSSTGGGGRGSDKGNIIGDVINHGKRQYWGRGGNYFYHCTLKKGENTLEAQIARLFLRSVASKGSYSIDGFREEFVTFMTTPGSHNDTYASTYIRMFFANQQKGLPLSQCPDNDSHNVDAMDAMTVIGPSVIWALGHGQDPTVQAEAYLQTLRKSKALVPFVRVYTEMIVGLIGAAETGTLSPAERLKGAASAAAKSLGVPLERAVREYRQQDPMVACYIDSAFPAMLVFVYKYAEEGFEAALLASANAGGENVARSSVLGTLFGLAYGYEAVAKTHPDLIQGLHEEEAIRTEIEAILV